MKNKTQIVLIVLALVGLIMMSYLTYVHYAPSGYESFCTIGENFSCDIVNKSEYAEVLGIPIAITGVLYFLAVLILAIRSYNRRTLKNIALATIVFLGPSLYLTSLEHFVIHSWCLFCEISKITMVAIVGVSIAGMRPQKIGKNMIMGALIAAVIAGGAVYLIQNSEGDEEGKYDTFAQCLYDNGLRMYGSVTCASCAKQRAMFGASFEFVREVECDPRNDHAEVDRCIEKDIEHTPTWILEDEEGNTIEKLPAGIVDLEKLGEVAGCPFEEDVVEDVTAEGMATAEPGV